MSIRDPITYASNLYITAMSTNHASQAKFRIYYLSPYLIAHRRPYLTAACPKTHAHLTRDHLWVMTSNQPDLGKPSDSPPAFYVKKNDLRMRSVVAGTAKSNHVSWG